VTLFLGTKIGFVFGPVLHQVSFFLQWIQWLMTLPLQGKYVVCINIDETPVCRQMAPRKGFVISLKRKHDRNCFARVPLRDRRGQTTVLATIVDRPELQNKMPQFVLTNDKIMSKLEKDKLAHLPDPIRWVVGSTGWVSAETFKQLLTEIRRSILAECPHAEIVLFMDCSPVHTARETLIHCSRLGLHVCLIPGGMTFLCQPLDSHVFATFKQYLADAQERERDSTPGGVMPPGRWVDVLADAISNVLVGRNWSHTFMQNGLSSSWTQLRHRIGELAKPHLPLPLRLLESEEMNVLLGKKRTEMTDLAYRASQRMMARPVPRLRLGPAFRLPRAPPARAAPGVASGSSGAASPRPPLPPPAWPHPDAVDAPRLTRSGSMY